MDLTDFVSSAFISKMNMNTVDYIKAMHAGSALAQAGYTGGCLSGRFKNKQEGQLMRYLLAIVLLAIGVVPVILEGNGTFLIITAIVALTLILDKRDWTKGPYGRSTQ